MRWMICLVLIGCSQSPEERICNAAYGCGALAAASVDECITALGMIDAERAAAECADCIEAKTCGQIAEDACATDCGPFASQLATEDTVPISDNKPLSDVTEAEATALCTYAINQMGGENVQEACSNGTTMSSGTHSYCVTDLLAATCNLPVSAFKACYSAVNSPCDWWSTPACSMLAPCWD